MFTQELKKSSKKLDDFSFYEAIYYQVIQTLLLFVFICFIVYFLFYFIYLFIHLCIYFVVCFLGGGVSIYLLLFYYRLFWSVFGETKYVFTVSNKQDCFHLTVNHTGSPDMPQYFKPIDKQMQEQGQRKDPRSTVSGVKVLSL